MHRQSGLSRRRVDSNPPDNVADASVVVTSGPRNPKHATKEASRGNVREENDESAIECHCHRRRHSTNALVAFVALVVVLAAVWLQKQRHSVDLDFFETKLSVWKEEFASFWRAKEAFPSQSLHPDNRSGDDADADADNKEKKPPSTSTSDAEAEAEAAAAREELALEARRAAEAAAETSLGASGFVTADEWEALLLWHERESSNNDDDDDDGDDDDASSEKKKKSKRATALAAVEALVRRRAGAAARGALLADAASLPWQGVPRRVALEAARRCSDGGGGGGGGGDFAPEFFVGGGRGDDDDDDEEGDDDDEENENSPRPKSKCPLASSLPRSYPGDFSPSSPTGFPFSALGYETLPLLQSLMASNGFDRHHYAQAAASFFSQTRGHVNALARRVTERAIAAANAAAGNDDGNSKALRLSLTRAAEDNDASSAVVKVAPLLARFACTPELRKVVAGAVAVHQRSVGKKESGGDFGGSGAAAPAARARAAAGALAAVAERIVVLGETIPEAVASASRLESLSELARSYLREALDAFEEDQKEEKEEEHSAALSRLLASNAGKGDGGSGGGGGGNDDDSAPAALKGGLAAALMHPTDFAAAARASMLAGGDAAARAHVVGALLGAATVEGEGSAAAPPEWRKKCEKAIQADAMIHLVLHQRGEKVPVAMPGQEVPGAAE